MVKSKSDKKEMQSNLTEMQSSETEMQRNESKMTLEEGLIAGLEDAIESVKPEAAPVQDASPTPPPAPQPPKEQVWLIQHAAKHMIAGYKDTWWASIRSMADHMRLGESATESQCKSLFLRWGAKLK